MARHNELGKTGEELAVEYLSGKGYEILERNWRFQKAEIDIIARKSDLLVMVEVKTRSTDVYGDPQDFLKPKQKNALVKAMNAYVEQQDLDLEVRFDVLGIVKSANSLRIEHFEDAFFYF